jgi:hypothetical protein
MGKSRQLVFLLIARSRLRLLLLCNASLASCQGFPLFSQAEPPVAVGLFLCLPSAMLGHLDVIGTHAP